MHSADSNACQCPATARIENAGRDGAARSNSLRLPTPLITVADRSGVEYVVARGNSPVSRLPNLLTERVGLSKHSRTIPLAVAARTLRARERGSGLKGKSGRPQASRTAVALIGFIRFACTTDRTSREIRMPPSRSPRPPAASTAPPRRPAPAAPCRLTLVCGDNKRTQIASWCRGTVAGGG
jgi:hypothetical protein